MNRTIRLTILALALWPAFAFAQSAAVPNQYPEWDQLTQAQRDAFGAHGYQRVGVPDVLVRSTW